MNEGNHSLPFFGLFLSILQLFSVDVDSENMFDLIFQFFQLIFFAEWKECFAQHSLNFCLVGGGNLFILAQDQGKILVYYEPQSKDSELAVVSVVLVVVKAVAFEEPMHTEHSTDELEDVGAGYVGHQQQDHEDNDGAAGVCPAKHIKHFLEGVYYSRNHPQHQLHNLFHLVNLFQKAGALFPQIKFFVVNDERPFLVLLVFCLLGLFEFAILCQPEIIFYRKQIVGPFPEFKLIGAERKGRDEERVPVLEETDVQDVEDQFSREREVVEHGQNQRVEKKSQVEEGRAKVEQQNQKTKKDVAHARVFEEVDVSPKGSDEEGDISNDPEDPVDSDHQLIRVRSLLESRHHETIIFVGIGISVHTGGMGVVDDGDLHKSLVSRHIWRRLLNFYLDLLKALARWVTDKISE